MRWESVDDSYLTPVERFFVRNNSATPRIDPATWKLEIGGPGAEREVALDLDDLARLPRRDVVCALECAGNGRRHLRVLFDEDPEGANWGLGGIGVARWTGVSLGDVLATAGRTTVVDVLPIGLDELRVRRPLPLDKALDPDVLVATHMNGIPLPPDHGFPARLIVPGWVGAASIKWLGRLELHSAPVFTPWNTTSYVLTGPSYAPEGEAPGMIARDQVVKSAVQLPRPTRLRTGRHTIKGRAWSAQGAIEAVHWSFDGTGPWEAARLSPPNIPRAWVRWELEWDAEPGRHELLIRATDDAGNTQPCTAPWNDKGYLYGAIVPHPITVS
jgi:DMSO/TMAO reductase YedYZ molybdopterin-dependent catalytic subunit